MRTLGLAMVSFGLGALVSAVVAYEHGYAAGRLQAFRQFYRERQRRA